MFRYVFLLCHFLSYWLKYKHQSPSGILWQLCLSDHVDESLDLIGWRHWSGFRSSTEWPRAAAGYPDVVTGEPLFGWCWALTPWPPVYSAIKPLKGKCRCLHQAMLSHRGRVDGGINTDIAPCLDSSCVLWKHLSRLLSWIIGIKLCGRSAVLSYTWHGTATK